MFSPLLYAPVMRSSGVIGCYILIPFSGDTAGKDASPVYTQSYAILIDESIAERETIRLSDPSLDSGSSSFRRIEVSGNAILILKCLLAAGS